MATRKKTNSSSAKRKATRGTKAQRQAVAIPRLGSTANDIVGLLLVVLAVAMIVALQMPSPAPVTYVTGEALELLFGAGAMLFPITLLVFALTFFIDNDEPLSGRLALGLTLVTLAVLSIVSRFAAGSSRTASEYSSMRWFLRYRLYWSLRTGYSRYPSPAPPSRRSTRNLNSFLIALLRCSPASPSAGP